MDREVERTDYHYILSQEIDGSDVGHLVDALEDEEFPLRELLGEAEMVRQIREGCLGLDLRTPAPLPWFGECLKTLSVYISEYITGLELAEGRNRSGFRVAVEVRKHIARRGELLWVRLKHRISLESGEIHPAEEDVLDLERRWPELPRWAQDAYRIKFPELRRL